jgi:hypothetical protein
MASQEQTPRFRRGQTVKIITCLHQHPEHIGQVGTLAPHTRGGIIRVYIGTGICRATEVEAVNEDLPQEEN